MEKFRKNCAEFAGNYLKILEEFNEMIFVDFPINNLREILHKFKRKFWRFFESTPRNSGGIFMKFWENCKKILNNSKKIMEILLGRIEVMRS